jgi:hypothetical protein
VREHAANFFDPLGRGDFRNTAAVRRGQAKLGAKACPYLDDFSACSVPAEETRGSLTTHTQHLGAYRRVTSQGYEVGHLVRIRKVLERELASPRNTTALSWPEIRSPRSEIRKRRTGHLITDC